MSRLQQLREMIVDLYKCRPINLLDPIEVGDYSQLSIWGFRVTYSDELEILTIGPKGEHDWQIVKEEDEAIVDALLKVIEKRQKRAA